MKTLAIVMGKVISKAGSVLNRGSSLPGYVSRKLDNNILSKLDLGKNIVIVTGTNGKTSTTKYISATLKSNGYSVTSNASGANMPQGITTEILKHVGLNGKLKSDYLILEVDEAYVKTINQEIHADYLLVTNLFKDQVDRFPDINNVKEIILEGIVESNTLILNADDPYTRHLADCVDNKVIYFGYDNIIEEESVAIKCPQCQSNLEYTSATYNHLGMYHCECGFKRPENIDYTVKAYDPQHEQIHINNFTYTLNNPALYNTYNYLASVSVVLQLGLKEEDINKSLSKAVVGIGRMETFMNGSQASFVNLVKNEVGINQTLAYIEQRNDETYNLFLSVHSRVPDGPNIEWLKGVMIDAINRDQVKEFIVTGDEAVRVYELFIEQGVDVNRIKVIEDLSEAVTYVLNDKECPSYLLANYTSLPDVRKNVFS